MCHPIYEFCCCPQVWHHHISSQIPWSHPVRSLVVPGATAAILRVLQRLGLLGGHRSWDTAVRNDQFHIRSHDTAPDVPMVFPTKTERQVPSKSLSLKSSYHMPSCFTMASPGPAEVYVATCAFQRFLQTGQLLPTVPTAWRTEIAEYDNERPGNRGK